MDVLQRITSRKFLLSNLGVILAAIAPFVFKDEIEPKYSLIAITTIICVYILANLIIQITEILKSKK